MFSQTKNEVSRLSLGKVESVLKGCPVVANVCIFGDSRQSYVVAVVCPVPATLTEIAAKFGKQDLTFDEMVVDKDVNGAVLREVQNHAKKSRQNYTPHDCRADCCYS